MENCVVQNQSTDGVSCEVEWNKQTVLDYLSETGNVCALPDTNHNAKSGRYQQFGGSCAAVIGHYVIDHWILLDAGIAREVARVVLPVGLYSSMYVTMNSRALMNFLSLRTSREGSHFPSYPQREIEMVAEKMEAEFAKLMPLTHKAFEKSGRIAP